MDSPDMRTVHPREVLRQVADHLNGQHDDLSIALPAKTTIGEAVRAAEAALRDIQDEHVYLMPPRVSTRRQIRETALKNVSELDTQTPSLRPIRSTVELIRPREPRRPLSEAARERLRKTARETAAAGFREPYITLRAGLGENHLPVIRSDIILRVIDNDDADRTCELPSTRMIFDTGAHHTVIAENLIPPSFRDFLREPVHSPYRSGDGNGLVLQIDAQLAFTNCPVAIEAVAVVVPAARMPNGLVGVLLGQSQCIDRLKIRCVPRSILLAKGNDISEEFWGDIVVEEYLDMNEGVVSLSS
ncbi:hypothetical protein BJX68DRAFT_105798 [Aspergillus pseudodeflectus]|uniref:Peptidase A2 domain-containing protein n=1 Tax=Aspergillus pseudodeflectus TaxID=176178 RepID=A0ABR4K9M8_9EURO